MAFFFLFNVNALEKTEVKFSKCVDGDTAILKYKNKDQKFRFLAIDTPESVHPTKKVEPYGKEASEYTCNKLSNAKNIYVEFDDNSSKQDKYGRYLAWIYADDELLQKSLVENGLAKVSYIYGKYNYLDELYDLQNSASNKKINIWSNESNTYIVTFKSFKKSEKVSVNALEKVKELKASEKEGYKFLYWELGNEKYNFDTPVSSNLKLVAKYEKKTLVEQIIEYKYGFIIIIIIIILFFISPKEVTKIVKKLDK